MSTTRILITGRNKDFPKTVSMPIGVCVDGSVVSARIQIRADEAKCACCEGWGTVETWDGNPASREVLILCEACNGDGIVKVAA